MTPASLSRSRSSLDIPTADRKSTRLNSSHLVISYAVFCLKKKNQPRALITFCCAVCLHQQSSEPLSPPPSSVVTLDRSERRLSAQYNSPTRLLTAAASLTL